MSIQALAWAKRLPVKPASAKFVLFALADYATERKKTYPSMDCLCRETGLTPEQINVAIESLLSQAAMTDTGQRVGEQKEIRVFQLSDNTDVEPPKKKARKPKPEKTEMLRLAAEIYSLYPRRVGKPKALSQIVKAIQAFEFEVVMNGTKAFAAAWLQSGKDISFCPHPSTFYFQERFNDDPSAWGLTNAKKVIVGPTYAEVLQAMKEKEADTTTAAKWAAGFYSHWKKMKWQRNGKDIVWSEELSKQIATWRQQRQ